MSNPNSSLSTLHYSPADDSWYGWWADGEPATISATAMETAYLELFHRYQQQGMNAAAAGRQACIDVHSMAYWNAHAAPRSLGGTWSAWDGLALALAGVLLVVPLLR